MTFYDFEVKDIDGKPYDMSKLEGKKVLIVNVASECGFTPQYEQLQELYDKYRGKGFEIIAFPSNDFGGQEPGTHDEIKAFCQKNYGVTFPVMSKVTILGENMHPLYKWLTRASLNDVADHEVKWNFHKFMIDSSGNLKGDASTQINPLDEVILNFVEKQ